MLDSNSSLRLNLLRFPLIVGVVFIHAYGTTVGLSSGVVGAGQNSFGTDFVQNLISQGIARTAVPLFFLMSGYLFFVGVVWSEHSYIEKLKSRTKTLLIPFLFWNAMTLTLIALAQALPATQEYFTGKNPPVASFNAIDYLTVIFGIGRSPISYQFWFIRDLMILVLLAPIIFYINKKIPFPFIFVLFICWLAKAWPIFAPSSEALFFFAIGGLLANKGISLFGTDKYGKAITATYILVLLADIALIKSEFNPIFHKTGIILGVLTMLFLTKLAANSQAAKKFLLPLAGTSFFVFAAHEPLLYISRKVTYKLIEPSSDYSVLGLYFLLPILVIIFLIFSYRALSFLLPNFTRIITGGR